MTRKRILLLTTIAIGSLNFNTHGGDLSIQTETSDSATISTDSSAAHSITWSLEDAPSPKGDELFIRIEALLPKINTEQVMSIHYRVDSGSGYGPVDSITDITAGKHRIKVAAGLNASVQLKAISKNHQSNWSKSQSITPTVSTAPDVINFGALTAIGAGQERSSASDGVYGPFTVSKGQVSPNKSPLSPGIYSVGHQKIEVIENMISVSNADELRDAVENFSDTAIDLEFQLREGNYGLVVLRPSSFDTNTGTVTMTSADPNRMAQMRLTLAGASDGNFGRLIFDHLDFFESYDNFAAAFPDSTATYATNTKFAIVTLANTNDVTFRHCRFRSDFKASYDISLGSKWREAKQSQHPNGSFLLIRTTEMFGTQKNLTIEDSEVSDIFYGLFIQGNNVRLSRNTFHDVWCDAHVVFAPTDGLVIEDTYGYNFVGDILHPDFVQIYTRTSRAPFYAVDNFTFVRNVANVGPKSAFVEHTEAKPAFGVDASRMTFQSIQSQSNQLAPCDNWIVQDNIFGGVTSAAINLPIVTNADVRRNTVAPMFRNGSNNRVASTLRVGLDAGAGSIIAHNFGVNEGVLVNDPTGVTLYSNQGGLVASSLESVAAHFVGPSFELSDMVSKQAVIEAYRPKPAGPLDYDFALSSGQDYSAMSVGAIGRSSSSAPVDWTTEPAHSMPMPERDYSDPRDNLSNFTGSNPIMVARPSQGANHVLRLVLFKYDSKRLQTEPLTVKWGNASFTLATSVQLGMAKLYEFYMLESDFPTSDSELQISWINNGDSSPAATPDYILGCAQMLYGRAQEAPLFNGDYNKTQNSPNVLTVYPPEIAAEGQIFCTYGGRGGIVPEISTEHRVLASGASGSGRIRLTSRVSDSNQSIVPTFTFGPTQAAVLTTVYKKAIE